jgi:hypothetical protein
VLGIDRKREPKRQKGWRIASSLADYVEARAKGLGRGAETDIIEDALAIHRAFNEQLDGHKARLQQYAHDVGVDLRSNEVAILTRLILRGLQAHEEESRQRQK